jgi:hypothetical protein
LPDHLDKALAEALANLDEIFARYDEAAAELIRVARLDGHFAGRDEVDLTWPPSHDDDGSPVDAEGLERRVELIAEIHDGIPPRRNRRLVDAHDRYETFRPAYLRNLRLFLQVQRQFIAEKAGTERDFDELYSAVYLEALAREDPIPLDAGEAALVEFKVSRAPLAHAASIVDKIRPGPSADDPRWTVLYRWDLDGERGQDSLRELLRQVSEAVVDFLAAGEHLAIRYNTFSNFIWFGISVWKAVTEVELLVLRLRGRARDGWVDRLENYVRLLQGMLLKFLQAHVEDPAQIRPADYWYGQQYSYLTRDMIDLTRELVRNGERLRQRYRPDLPVVEVPPLLRGASAGAFHEYGHVGVRGTVSSWTRRVRLLKWVRTFRTTAKQKKKLHRSKLSDVDRRAAAWQINLEWAEETLNTFGIDVSVTIDPAFADVAGELDLRPGLGRKVVFFPTHQSLLDHPVMYRTLQSPELLQAMGWSAPVPCCLLSRPRLMQATAVKIGGREISLIGISPDDIDRLQEEVDGYVILRKDDTGSPIKRFAQILNDRPGVVYGGGTTSAFDLQVLPMQHALFAHLPQDTVFIPVALRGIHSLWPKAPRNNLNVSPGHVDVFISPPIPGETTLLPRKRALRTQLEPATLFQAIHIATLLDPTPQKTPQDSSPS